MESIFFWISSTCFAALRSHKAVQAIPYFRLPSNRRNGGPLNAGSRAVSVLTMYVLDETDMLNIFLCPSFFTFPPGNIVLFYAR